MQDSDYIQAISTLLLPSNEQIHNFAEYVSDAHSWYKHLPVYPASRFVFFLDPNAGRMRVHQPLSGKPTRFEDIADDTKKIHYSTKTTEEYRAHYGFWNYDANYGTSIIYGSGNGMLNASSSSGKRIHIPEKGFVPIPARLVEAGSAGVTALVHPHRNYHLYWALHPRDPKRRVEFPEVLEQEIGVFPEECKNAMLRQRHLEMTLFELSERLEEEYRTSWDRIMHKEVPIASHHRAELDSLEKEKEELLTTHIDPFFKKKRDEELQVMEAAMKWFLDSVSSILK